MSTTTPVTTNAKKVTTRTFRKKKERSELISMLTAYDYPTAMAVDQAGIDSILVGDSVGMVVLGYENTLSVTMDDMIHHCKAVSRGAKRALLVGDMPFMSYQISEEEALRNAGRFLQEAGMDAVKLEGGRERAEVIRKIVAAGIPVMGHLGLTPQSVNVFGGFLAQGLSLEPASRLFEDAKILTESGCFSIVLERVPTRLAEYISKRIKIPTIGIGAGIHCDGQVLVTHDMLGMFERFTPKFVKKYAQLYSEMVRAFEEYHAEVTQAGFPGPEHAIEMPDPEWEAFILENGG